MCARMLYNDRQGCVGRSQTNPTKVQIEASTPSWKLAREANILSLRSGHSLYVRQSTMGILDLFCVKIEFGWLWMIWMIWISFLCQNSICPPKKKRDNYGWFSRYNLHWVPWIFPYDRCWVCQGSHFKINMVRSCWKKWNSQTTTHTRVFQNRMPPNPPASNISFPPQYFCISHQLRPQLNFHILASHNMILLLLSVVSDCVRYIWQNGHFRYLNCRYCTIKGQIFYGSPLKHSPEKNRPCPEGTSRLHVPVHPALSVHVL